MLKRFFYSVFRLPINFLFTRWERGASVVCLIEYGGKWVFIRNVNYPKLWALPGGRMKKGESPAEAIMRETKEEVGIKIQKPQLFGEQHSERRGIIVSKTYCFSASADSEALIADEGEVLEARWCDKHNLPYPQSLTTERAIELFRKKNNANSS